MPRKSPFEIVLSKAERLELSQRAVAYTRPYFEVVRAKMILMAVDIRPKLGQITLGRIG